MSLTNIRADDLLYPVLFLRRDRFEVWPDAGCARSILTANRQGGGDKIGQLIDRQGLTYNVLGAEDDPSRDGDHLTQNEGRALANRTVTLVCNGNAFPTSVDSLRQTIAWLVSARGHFESAKGFGVPAGITLATSVEDLLKALLTTGFR